MTLLFYQKHGNPKKHCIKLDIITFSCEHLYGSKSKNTNKNGTVEVYPFITKAF